MTNPVGGRPHQTNDKYDDVYTRGSTYGSDLRSEEDVRKLLTSKELSGFGRFLQGIAKGVDQLVSDLAEVFRGNGGAKYEVLRVAVDERFAKITDGVTEAVDRAQKELDKANTALAEQGKLTEQQKHDLETAKTDLGKAKTDVKKALDDLATIQAEAGRIRNSLAGKVEESKFNTELANAAARVEKMEKALEGLYPVDGAGSLVVVKPDTLEPYWWLERGKANPGSWDKNDGFYKGKMFTLYKNPQKGNAYEQLQRHWVKVQTDRDYYWSVWLRVDNPSSVAITLAANGTNAGGVSSPIIKESVVMDTNPDAHLVPGPWGVIVNVTTAKKWVHCTGRFRFQEGVQYASLRAMEWSWGSGNVTAQTVGDLEIHPLLTDPSDVQTAINDANAKITNQINTNKSAVEKSVAEATDKITALQNGIPLGGSLIAYSSRKDYEGQPLWFEAAPGGMDKKYAEKYSNWSFPDGHQWRTGNPQGRQVTHQPTKKLVKVQPGVDYTFKIWTQATGEGSVLFIEFRNQNGEKCVKSGGLDANGAPRAGVYPVYGLKVPQERRHWVTKTLRFTDDTREVYLDKIWFNHPSAKETNQWIAGIECYPSTVDQAFVDKMQNEAILANSKAIGGNKTNIELLKTVADNQAKWNATQSVVNSKQGAWNKAASDAVEALKKWSGYQYLGTSCVPLVPGTSTPEWTLASKSKAAPYEFPGSANEVPGKSLVHVSSGLEYDVEITWSQSSSGYAYLNIYDQNGADAVDSVYQIIDGKRVDWATYIRDSLTPSEKTSSYVVTFKPSVSAIRVGKFFHPNGTLRVRDIKITPHVPSQANVDAAQNKAIDALSRVQAAEASTNVKFREKQAAINSLGKRIDAAQNKVLQIHQDTLELLDIRMPKVFYMPSGVKEGVYDPSTGNKYFPPVDYGWFQADEDSSRRKITVVCKGKWTGKLVFTSNWSNGATDNWVRNVTPTERGFVFTGGAPHITCRGYEFTVFPECLNRQCKYKPGNSPVLEDKGSLVRERQGDKFLFKGPVTFNDSVAVLKGPTNVIDRWVKPGTVVQGEWVQFITWNHWYTATEVNVSQHTFDGLDTSYPSKVTFTSPSNNSSWGSSGWNSSDWGSSGWGSSGWGSS